MPMKESARTLGLPSNTVERWLRARDMKIPAYPKRSSSSKLDAYNLFARDWLILKAHGNKRERKIFATLTEA